MEVASPRVLPGGAGSLPDLLADTGTAWRHGLQLGLHCSCCCAGLTAILLVIGVMNLRAMAVVTVAVTAERFAPAVHGVARAIGALAVGAGVFLLAQQLDLYEPHILRAVSFVHAYRSLKNLSLRFSHEVRMLSFSPAHKAQSGTARPMASCNRFP